MDLCYNRPMWTLDTILDRSIVFSFDRGGFLRHQRNFDSGSLKVDLRNKTCLITGANSGLGFETAKKLAKLGAQVILVCRNRSKGLETMAKIEGTVRLEILDVSDLKAIQQFVSDFEGSQLDILIHNAGVLPTAREETRQGNEMVFATHVLGPFLMTRLLLPKLLAAQSPRVIWVSSGGMYAQKLDLQNLQSVKSPYNGVTAYANAKRAQVILNELWAERFPSKEIVFNSMHPGWVDTPGVVKSLPRFWKVMKNRLRLPKEGADTIVWLAVCEKIAQETGKFWFDRCSVATHLFPWTRETKSEREQLWNIIEGLTSPFMHQDALKLESKHSKTVSKSA